MILQLEMMEQDPTGWRMLVGCILLNLTHRRQVDGVHPQLFREYPDAEHMASAQLTNLERTLQPLGLFRRRALTLKKFSGWWVDRTPLNRAGREAIVMMEPPGIGEYARDSWVIFYDSVVPSWEVKDKELKKYLVERVGASGVVWHPE